MGDALALAALAVFSANAFMVRAASARLDQGLGFLVALAANIVFAGALVAVQVGVQGGLPPATWRAAGLFLLSGILATYLGRRGYFRSVQAIGPTRAAAIQVTNPVFAMAFAWVLLGQHLRPLDVVALVLVVCGLYLAGQVRPAGADGRPARHVRIPVVVLLPAVAAAGFYALGNVARAAAVQEWAVPVVGGFLASLSGAAAYALIHVRPSSLLAELRAADRRGLWLWFAAGTLTITGQICVIAASYHLPVAVAVAISSALPIVVLPISVWVLRNVEGVTARTAGGVGLVVAGVVGLVLG